MGFAFSIPSPPVMTSAANTLSFIEIDLPAVLPIDCVFPMNYFGKLIVTTLVPLGLYAIMLISA